MDTQQADELIAQCNNNLTMMVANMTDDQIKSVMNAKNAILECITQYGDDGWVALSMLLADMTVEED